MLSLKGRQDGFRLLLPKDFICEEIYDKYARILESKNSYIYDPIDFLNETIQGVQVLGFQNGTFQQTQISSGRPMINEKRVEQNRFAFPSTEYNYRTPASPIALMDRTVNIIFRHTLGFLNYFIIFENFWWQNTRDQNYDKLPKQFTVDIFNEKGSIYSRIVLDSPLINSMDMLDLSYTQPVASSQTFNVEFKYSNFDFQFIDDINVNENSKLIIDVENSYNDYHNQQG